MFTGVLLVTEEEDQIIMLAHQTHGNKWKSISNMLPGRTGYAIKNHWNVSLKNKQAEQRSPELGASDMTAVQILTEMKASAQKALSFRDVGGMSGNREEGESGHCHGHQNYEDQAFQAKGGFLAAETRKNSPVVRPKASYGAFSVYYPPGGGPGNSSGASTVVPLQGPLAQALGSEFGVHHFLEHAHGEPLIPHQCGHGCYSGQIGPDGGSSLLGPDFIDYIEPPSSSQQELMSIAADLSQMAWTRNGPGYASTGMPSMEMWQPTRPSERDSAAFATEASGEENKNDPSGKLKGAKQ
ncbi:Lectin_legB domain-containing protein [Psidium guajava]|nr:Lectin_legB domain-containing protein [Psidium guajava]